MSLIGGTQMFAVPISMLLLNRYRRKCKNQEVSERINIQYAFLLTLFIIAQVCIYYEKLLVFKSSRNGPVHKLSWFFSHVGIWLKDSTLCCHCNEATVMKEHIAYCCLHIL